MDGYPIPERPTVRQMPVWPTTAPQTTGPSSTTRPAAAQQGPPMRASDTDRMATVHVLQDAVARGLLTPDEGSDRMAAAFAAVHLRDLTPLTADLPPAPAAAEGVPSRPGAPGWGPLGAMAWAQVRASAAGPRSSGPTTLRLVLATVLALLLFVVLVSFLVHGVPGDWGGHSGPGRGAGWR